MLELPAEGQGELAEKHVLQATFVGIESSRMMHGHMGPFMFGYLFFSSATADHEKSGGNAGSVVAERFAAHKGVGYSFWKARVVHQAADLVADRGIVFDRLVADREFDFDLTVGGEDGCLDSFRQELFEFGVRLISHRPNRCFHDDTFRDDVYRRPPVVESGAENRVKGGSFVFFPDHIQRVHDVASDDNRIVGEIRSGSMAALPDNLGSQSAGIGAVDQSVAPGYENRTGWSLAPEMEADQSLNSLQSTFADYVNRASWRQFLARFEDESDVVGPIGPHSGLERFVQHQSQSQQAGGVEVMPAGMTDARLSGGKFFPSFLLHPQGVDVRPETEKWVGGVSDEIRDNSGSGELPHLETFREAVDDQLLSFDLISGNFRIFMDFTPEFYGILKIKSRKIFE